MVYTHIYIDVVCIIIQAVYAYTSDSNELFIAEIALSKQRNLYVYFRILITLLKELFSRVPPTDEGSLFFKQYLLS